MEKNPVIPWDALDYIEEHPEEWNQGDYFKETDCGTVACFAGRVVIIHFGSYQAFRAFQRSLPTDRPEFTADIAARVLGWTEEEAHSVFYLMTDHFEVLKAAVMNVMTGGPLADPGVDTDL